MATQTVFLPPLDPNLLTGPTRMHSGVARTAAVTPGTYYGINGQVEFMRKMYVGVTGNVAYMQWDGTTQTLDNLAAGIWHDICSIQVISSGTTATNIVVGS